MIYSPDHREVGTEIHTIGTDTACRITFWNCGNETIIAEEVLRIESIFMNRRLDRKGAASIAAGSFQLVYLLPDVRHAVIQFRDLVQAVFALALGIA